MIVIVDQSKKQEIDRRIAIAAVDSWFAEKSASGYQTADGWKLGLSEGDVTLLTGAFVLAKEAVSAGLPLPEIVDLEGTPHSLAMPEMTALMLAYGQFRAGLSAEYAARKAAIG